MERGTEWQGWDGVMGGGGGGGVEDGIRVVEGRPGGGGGAGAVSAWEDPTAGGRSAVRPGLARVRNFQQNEGGRGGTEEQVAHLFVKLLE